MDSLITKVLCTTMNAMPSRLARWSKGSRDRYWSYKALNAVSNRAVIGAIRNAFDSHNMKWDGQHYDAHARLTGKAVYQDTEDIKVTTTTKMYAAITSWTKPWLLNVNDSLGLRLTAHNSFDRGSECTSPWVRFALL